jgi:SAM-dependent methyltransferase
MEIDMGSATLQNELWSKQPNDWCNLSEPNHRPLFSAMLEATQVDKNTVRLDVGCGGGTSSVMAAERGAEVYGIDASTALVEIASQRLTDASFVEGDIENMSYSDGQFDVVFAANVLQYAENRQIAAAELARVCSKTGKIIVGLFGSPDRVAYRAIFEALKGAMPSPPPGKGPFELSLDGALENVLKSANLRVIADGEVNCPFVFSDLDILWRAAASGGPLQAQIKIAGEEELKKAIQTAGMQFQLEDGSIDIGPNYFRYVVAERS